VKTLRPSARHCSHRSPTARLIGVLLTLALVALPSAPGVAQSLSPVGRYNMEWAQMDKGLRVDLTGGTRLVEVVGRDLTDPPDFGFKMRDATTLEHLWFLKSLGNEQFEAWTGGFGIGIFVGPVVGQGMQGFYLEAEVGSGHNPGTYVAVGRRVTVSQPAPTPPPTSGSGSVKIAVTAPRANATVTATAWATVWMEGSTSTTNNTFVLYVDGVERGRTVTNSRGPVSVAWNTRAVTNGNHVITVKGTDSLRQTGTSPGVTVVVRN
jgi:hypothetical protein